MSEIAQIGYIEYCTVKGSLYSTIERFWANLGNFLALFTHKPGKTPQIGILGCFYPPQGRYKKLFSGSNFLLR